MEAKANINGQPSRILYTDAADLKSKLAQLEGAGHNVEIRGEGMSALAGAAQGLTFDWADEAYGRAGQLFTDQPYEHHRDKARNYFEGQRAANPVAYGVGEFTGGAILPGGAAGTAVKAASKARKAAKAAAILGSGAVAGGLAGAGNSKAEKLSDIAGDAAIPALIGAGAAGLMSTILPVVGHLGGSIKDSLARSPEKKADDAIRGVLEGGRPEDITQRMQNLGGRGALMDVDDSLMALAGAAKDRGNEASRVVDDFVTGRADTAKDTVVNAMEAASGTRRGRLEPAKKAIERARDMHNETNYRVVDTEAVPNNESFATLKNLPLYKPYFDKAKKAWNTKHRVIDVDPMEGDDIPLDYIQSVKVHLDKTIEDAKYPDAPSADKANLGLLKDLRREVVAMADEAVPEYGVARRQHARKSGMLDAADEGATLGKKGETGAHEALTEAEAAIGGMAPFEQTMFRGGLMDSMLGNKVGGQPLEYGNIASRLDPNKEAMSRKLGLMSTTPDKAATLEDILGAEKRFGTVRNYVSTPTGSRTAERIMAGNKADESMGILSDVASTLRNPEQVANVVSNFISSGVDEQTALVIARRLTDQTMQPEEIARMMSSGKVPKDVGEMILEAMQTGNISRLLGGMTAVQPDSQ